jgi:thiamine transporter
MSQRLNTALLAELSVAIALAAVLSVFKIKLPHLIYGGSVSLHTIPVAVIALRHGVRAGVLTGTAYGFVNFIMTPNFYHPIQVVLDYPVAFGVLGIAGLAAGRASTWHAVLAVTAAGALRLAVHVLSGIVYFSHYAPAGTPVWTYSLLYNSSYMVPETLITGVVMGTIIRRLLR